MNKNNKRTPSFMDSTAYPITVLLIDDQPIVAQAIRQMLSDQDIKLVYCQDPSEAIPMCIASKPTVILQDLIMPEIDGLLLVKYFRVDPATKDIPLIVLSGKEEPIIKAEAFSVGVNDYLIKLPDKAELVARIRYHSKNYIRLLQRNEAYEKLRLSQLALNSELAEAAAYVKDLLPAPIRKGNIVTNWEFIPSTQLGGDAFGYHWLDQENFAFYLLDVCGHGIGAALLSISLLNIIRSHNLPEVDFHNPSEVLKGLNHTFPMENHYNMFSTVFYGVCHLPKMEITYASGGHPPGLLLCGDSIHNFEAIELRNTGFVIGGMPETKFENIRFSLCTFNKLYLFSDGVYEIEEKDRIVHQYHEFKSFLIKCNKEHPGIHLEKIVNFVKEMNGNRPFVDDFSILQLIFYPLSQSNK